MSLTSRSVNRPVATAMVYCIIVVLGIVGFRYLPVDLLPPIEFPRLTVVVNYDNVGPEEMEQIITDMVENALAGVPNIEEISSNSSEGTSRVRLNFGYNTDLEAATNDVRDALDRVRRNLPDEAESPRIWKFDPDDTPIVMIGARSNRDLAELTRILEQDIAKNFEQIPGTGSIDVWGSVNEEVRVDLNRERMVSSELTSSDVVNAINQENVNLPGGNIRDGFSDLYVRTQGEYESIQEIAQTVITTVDGDPIRVGDIANVENAYEDIGRYIEIDDVPTLRMAIRKQTDANTVAVAEDIKREVERINSIRNDLQLEVISDQSEFIQSSINNVRNSALWGGILALIVLFAFLRNGSTTFIIGVTIPISVIATFGLIYFGGLSLNMMSFGGIALGIGLIVDNAIVVLDNIVRNRQMGKERKESALLGTKQVAGAIIAATLTTSVIFLPVVFMQSVTGMMFQELALVVVFALLASLIAALTLVPMISNRFLTYQPDDPDPEKRTRHQRFFEQMENKYKSMLARLLERKKYVGGVTLILIIVSVAFIPQIPFELAPQTDADEVRVRMRMDDGVNIAVMYDYMMELDEIVQASTPPDAVQYFTRDVRNGRADVQLTLTDRSERDMSSSELADHLNEQVSNTIPGADIRVTARSGLWVLRRVFGGGGRGGGDDGDETLELQLRGHDLETIEDLSQRVRNRIEPLSKVSDVEIGEDEGRPQQNIRVDRERLAQLGIGMQEVASTIQANIGGSVAGYYRVEGEERPIRVRLRPQDRVGPQDLDNITIRSSEGEILPISTVVSKSRDRAPTSINRVNSQRVEYISVNLHGDVALGDAVNDIQTAIADMNFPEGYSVYFGGEYEEQQQAQRDFTLSILIALLLVYMVMAAQFERFVDPLIVMFSVPVAIIGVVPTMLITGTTFNMQSMMGAMMLLGIVVNNAIVLVDYINLMRRERGLDVYNAVIEAGRLRLRPILMTTLTTILALFPLSFGFGTGGEIQASLARVVIGGLASSTLITLVLIPVVYVAVAAITFRVKEWIRHFRGDTTTTATTESQ